MSWLAILNPEEIKTFDKPPKFTLLQREKYFYINTNNKKKLKQLLNDDAYYALLEEISVALQRRVSNIIKVIDFDEITSNKAIMEAIHHYKKTDGNVIMQNPPIDFLDNKQRGFCIDADGKIRVSLYKTLLFIHIAECIKAGSLNLKYSYRYKAIQDYLIHKNKWDTEKSKLLDMAGLNDFTDVHTVLAQLKNLLDTAYQTVNGHIDSGDNNYMRFSTASGYTLDTPKVIKQNTGSISELLNEAGFVPIIQILSDINRFTQFTDCFKHYSVKNQKLKPTQNTIIAGLMAKGHNIGINKISHISVGINSNTLRQTVNWFFTNKNIQTANNKIISMINKLSLANIFKYQPELTHTSSDGQKYQVIVDSLLANHSFKYFGKDKGVTVYTFVDDTHSLFYSIVISASEREAAYVIDGLLHNGIVKSDIHSTDMHGFTESIFAATHFIGTSFAPRFKNINVKGRKNWLSAPFHLYMSWNPMWLAISLVKHGAQLDMIANNVETYAKSQGFSMLKLPITAGHSLGHMHMDGWLVPLYKTPLNQGRVLKTGMVITIETFMSAGNGEAYILNDESGSAITKDGSVACYWEHAVAVTETGCEILDLRADEKASWVELIPGHKI
jgi:hypothetical protein